MTLRRILLKQSINNSCRYINKYSLLLHSFGLEQMVLLMDCQRSHEMSRAHRPSQFMLGLYNLSFIDIVMFGAVKSNSQREIGAVNSFALL